MNDNEEGKIFVGGLAAVTTPEKMKDYFSQWGEVVDVVLMKDKVTGNSRGFGFIKFQNPDSIQKCLDVKYHNIDNKQIDPKPCTPKGIQQQKKQAAIEHTQTHKIFVGGIPKDAVEQDLRTYFERFGTVSEVVFVINKEDGHHKGFGFVTFEDGGCVDACLTKHFHEIKGKKCETKRALPRDKMTTGRPPADRMHQHQGGHGGNDSNGWNNSYGYGNMGGGGGPGSWGGAGGNMGAYGGGAGYNAGYGGAGAFPTSYPGYGGGAAGGYGSFGGYGYGSQAMGYAGGVGGKSEDNSAAGKGQYPGMGGGGYGGSYGANSNRGGYGGGASGANYSQGQGSRGNYAGNGGDASSGRSGGGGQGFQYGR